MRAVVLEMPPHWFEERRRLGHDIRDEVWDGVLHMVPQPGFAHQMFGSHLIGVLLPIAEARGLFVTYETSVFSASGESNYRVPDLVVVRPEHASERGVERIAEIAVELLSPDDESRDKLPFYAMCGVREVWLIDPATRAFEILALEDRYATVRTASAVLGVTLSTVEGPKLHIKWADGSAEI